MHALVQRRERVEVSLLGSRFAAFDPVDRSLQDPGDVVQRLAARRVAMVPAEAIRDLERIVDAVRTGQQRLCAIEVAQDPVLLEPADVADLPDGRLEKVALLPEQLRISDALE